MKLALTAQQDEVCFSKARNIGLFAGRRWGKSTCFIARFKIRALTTPNMRYAYLTPTSQQNVEVFETLLADEDLQPFIKRTKTRPCQLWLTNGSQLSMNSFQRSSNLRGKFLDEAFLDEAQNIDGRDFARVVRPMLADKRGTAIVSGQLINKTHFTYRDFFEPGQAPPGSALNPLDKGIPRFQSFAFPSSGGIVFWGEEGRAELEIARQILPRYIFEAEYLCIPTASMNATFRPDDIDAIQKLASPISASPESGERYLIGFDVGRVIDHGAFVVMRHSDGAVVHASRNPLGMRHADQARQLAALSRRFNNAVVAIDSTGGGGGGHTSADQVIGLYRREVPTCRPVFLTWQNKGIIIESLCIAIEQHKIRIPASERELLEELGAYEATYANGHWSYSSPKNSHDDLVIALALAQWGRFKKWNSWDEANAYRGIL